jgi:hypothetical protein
MAILMERARSSKKQEAVTKKFMPAFLKKTIYKPLNEWLAMSTGPKILAVFRDEESCGPGRVGIFVGVTDPLTYTLAVPDGPDAFFGHPILALDCDLRGAEPEIQGIFDEMRKSQKDHVFPKRINYYQLTDKSLERSVEAILFDAKAWIESIDKGLLGKEVG